MAVAEGRNGKITVRTSSAGPYTVAEMGEWSIGGQSRNMIDYTAFGDVTAKYKPGMLDPGTVTFSGFFDGSQTKGVRRLLTALSSGGYIGSSSGAGTAAGGKCRKIRLWANSDLSFESYGFWSCTGSPQAKLFVTGCELGQSKDGLGTMSLTLKVSNNVLKWCTTT